MKKVKIEVTILADVSDEDFELINNPTDRDFTEEESENSDILLDKIIKENLHSHLTGIHDDENSRWGDSGTGVISTANSNVTGKTFDEIQEMNSPGSRVFEFKEN